MDGLTGSGTEPADHELMAAVAEWDAQPALARKAMAAFYSRHVDAVYRFATRFRRRLGGLQGVDDLVQDVFARVRRSARTFRVPPGTVHGDETRLALGWLQRIATNLYIDKVRIDKRRLPCLVLEQYELNKEQLRLISRRIDVDPPSHAEHASRELTAVQALALLSERDQDILLCSLDWFDRDRHRFMNVPSDVISALCERYGLRSDNYRQIRDRAMKRVTAFLTQAA